MFSQAAIIQKGRRYHVFFWRDLGYDKESHFLEFTRYVDNASLPNHHEDEG